MIGTRPVRLVRVDMNDVIQLTIAAGFMPAQFDVSMSSTGGRVPGVVADIAAPCW